MFKLFLLTLFFVAMVHADAPLDDDEPAEGLELDPEIFSRVTQIFMNNPSGPALPSAGKFGGHGNGARSRTSGQSSSRGRSSSPSIPNVGNSQFQIDEIQNAPVVARFTVQDPNFGAGAAVGRGQQNNGYSSGATSGGYNNRY